ncbi:MAG TPA: MFS transporter [Candidatus Hydrogenedens sp.]|nr:MFS transporter [Candidatus Hydrogenedens sp.]HPP58291.1 MFS transporter [Candidatus Hydrogenedens sp.]
MNTGVKTTKVYEEEHFNKLGFFALLATQFQGAFSDNVYKLIIILSVPIFLAQDSFWHRFVTPVCTALFNLPWLLFPALAGSLADRYSKQKVTVWTKMWELGVMVMGAFSVFLRSPLLLMFTLFLMAMQSAFFSPAKYGILPEILPETRLSWGNGLLNLWTFIAIILGNAVGGVMIELFKNNLYIAMFSMVGLSTLGLISSLFVTKAPPIEPERKIEINPFAGQLGYLKIFFKDKKLLLAMLGIAYFWFAGALIMQNIVEYGKSELSSGSAIGILLALIAVGIALGSVIAGYLSRGKIELGLVPIGSILMIMLCFLLSIPGLSLIQITVLMFFLGFGAGIFDVPVACLLQRQSPNQVRGTMIATSNLVTFGGMTISAGLFLLLFSILHCPPRFIFLVTGILSLFILGTMAMIEKEMILRAFLWILDSTLYRVYVSNRNKLPEKGGALLVSNHVSFVDVLVLFYVFDKKVYFVVGEDILKVRWMRWFSKLMNIIILPNDATPKDIEAVIVKIRQQLALGNWVCIPWEKRFHPNGPEMPWHKDYGILTQSLEIPIIPIYMDRITELVYRIRDGKIHWIIPESLLFPIYVEIGDPINNPRDGYQIRESIQLLSTHSYKRRPYMFNSILHRAFVSAVRRNPFHFCMADAMTGHINYFKAFMGTLILGRKLKQILGNEKMVGILVPPTVGGALVNIALQIMGKVPVNLNYTQSSEIIASCAKTCGIKHVLTSKKFLERVNITVPETPIYLEEVREKINTWDKVWGILSAIFLPILIIEKLLGAPSNKEEDLATIIFSSGSEGNPKGIMLTKRNIMSQSECIRRIVWHDKNTCVLGFLPFFHSFGFTVTLWLPLTNGVRCVYHPNPLEPKIISGLAQKYGAHFLLATSTFLQGFIRKSLPEEFKTLYLALAGAEKLPDRIRKGFYEKFGIEPLEGYGATECSPLVSANLPDFASPGFFNQFNKVGTVGRPLPGVSVRITHPETGEILPVGEEGMLEVTGPNIMLGYLNLPEKTEQALRGEWYRTGDIAKIDEDGYITLTDRLARFSKIAGEMISHTRVEEVLHELLGLTDLSMAVTGVPDEQKGERLVVLHTLEEEQVKTLLELLEKSELPNLWKPRANSFYKVDSIPILGTGKLDIRAVKKMAMSISNNYN